MIPLSDDEHLFTSESVTEGHPDKMADQISDAILDAALTGDPSSRVACETLITTGLVVVAGEITTTAPIEFVDVVRRTICEIGYDDGSFGFDGHHCAVMIALDKQSPDIAQGVDVALEHRTQLSEAELPDDELNSAGAGALPYLRPDGKTQVTVRYRDGVPVSVEKVLISSQHSEEATAEQIRKDLWEHVVLPELPAELFSAEELAENFYVNPTGRFVIGGPVGDAGLTGRKIIVDTYGGFARHGGGAFSGKDSSKVDRSAAYAARWVAKNIVAAGLAEKVEVQVAYAIGVARPLSTLVETFGTEHVPLRTIRKLVDEHFDLRPAAFRRHLQLNRPIFAKTAAYGHFGRNDPDFTWERTDKAAELRAAAGLADEDLRDGGSL
jgi:S-adenosylmethionine synthetase